MRSLLAGMMAVCGIGMPSGWRNRAVTANQSASAPTIAASAVARTGAEPGEVVLERPGHEEHDGGGEQQADRQAASSGAGRPAAAARR